MGEGRPPGKDIKQNGSISDLRVTSHLEQTRPSPPAHPGRRALEANPEWFRKSPGPGAGAGRKGAIKGEREKWGFLGNEHIWKQGRKGAGSCSHKTIWQLCVSLGEGLWKWWGCRCTPKPCPLAISSRLQWAARGNYIWGQVFAPLFGFNLGLRLFALPCGVVKHEGEGGTDSSWPGTLALLSPCPASTKCSL